MRQEFKSSSAGQQRLTGFSLSCSQISPAAAVIFRFTGSGGSVFKVVQPRGCQAGAGNLVSLHVELFMRLLECSPNIAAGLRKAVFQESKAEAPTSTMT